MKQSENFLKSYIRLHHSVPILFEILASHQFPPVRQMAGVLLRAVITSHWIHLDVSLKAAIKQNLFGMLAQEQVRLVRRTLANLISKVARAALSSGEEWPELVPSLFEIAKSAEVDHKEIVLYVFDSLLQNGTQIVEWMSKYFGDILGLCAQIFEKEHVRVKVAAVQLIGSMLCSLEQESDVAHFHPLIPAVFETIRQCIREEEEEDACSALSVFDDIIESNIAFLFLKPVVANFLQFILEIGATKTLDMTIRQQALTAIQWFAQYKPKQILHHNFIQPILTVGFSMMAEPEDEEDEDDDDDGEWEVTAHKFGAHIINEIATRTAPKQVYKEAKPFINGLIASSSQWERRAAVGGLTVLANGCGALMLPELEEWLLPLMNKALDDESRVVRQSACVMVGQWSDFLPDLVDYASEILPKILKAMYEDDPLMQERACYSFVALIEYAEEEVIPFVEPAMQRLVYLLQHSARPDVQEMAISGISAIASAAEEAFIPHYPGVLDMMKALLENHPSGEIRGRALECAGLIALAIKEKFLPYLEYFLNGVIAALNNEEIRDDVELFAFGFLSSVSELMKEDFNQVLPQVLPHLLRALANPKGLSSDAEFAEALGLNDEEAAGEEYSVTASFVDLKVSALDTLALFAYNCKSHMIKYLDECLPVVNFYLSYIHPSVRKAARKPAEAFVTIVSQAYPAPGGAWIAGVPAAQQPLSEPTRSLVESLLKLYSPCILKDPSADVVLSTLNTINQMIRQLGPASIEPYMEEFSAALSAIIKDAAYCQEEDSGEEEEEYYDSEGENEQNRLALIQEAGILVTTLAKVFQQRSEFYFPFCQLMMQWMQHQDGRIRQEAVGCMAEVAEALGVHSASKIDFFMTFAMNMVGDTYAPAASNAAYLCGILCQFGGEKSLQYYPNILQAAPQLLKQKQSADNACGMLGRMIRANPQALPMDQVLPALFESLPLKHDMEENKAVYPSISLLVQSKHPSIAPFIAPVVLLFTELLSSSKVQEEVKQDMATTLKFLCAEFPQQMEQMAAQLSASQQENLRVCAQ
eukprot:TRINITY_DN4410_c0_g1_i1.p1 TRINITY_DN4410_c0_g1~~TRINITY_DN4410_c0_g1_i1.p1  ORF type:complete len:1067 (-),score=295.62 TRINITY_DN4410_c0_g1_i1:10-3135(-)